MNGLCYAFLLLLLRLESHVLTANYPELKFVQILFRHGARSPLFFYPTNIHKDYWTEGKGQLTQIGKMDAFNFGDYVRRRYDGFLSANYSQYEVSVKSSDEDRTLMSAECMLAALYPPEGTQVWNKDIQWQPVPVHTVPFEEDFLLAYVRCPVFEKLLLKAALSTWLKGRIQPYQDTIHYLRTMSGYPKYYPDLLVIKEIYYTTIDELSEGLVPASWLTTDLVDTLSNDIFPITFEVMFGTNEQSTLVGGVFLREIYNNMLMVVKGVMDQQKKLYLYSAHDENMVIFQYLLNAFNHKVPPNSAGIMVELWEMSQGTYAVRVLYRNVTNSDETHTIILPGCAKEFCPLETFYNLTVPYMLTEEERVKACRIDEPNIPNKVSDVGITLSVSAVIIILLLFIIYRLRKRVSTEEKRPLVNNI